MAYTWYYLDPDNNKDEPKGLYCARCKRPLKDTQAVESFLSIVLHPVRPLYRLQEGLEPVPKHLAALIGEKCHNKMVKKYGEQTDTAL